MPLRKKTFRPSIWARILMLESWKVTLGRPSDGGISISTTADRSIQALDIIDIRVSKAILWSVLEVRSARSVERLSGLTAAGAEDLREALLLYLHEHFAMLIDAGKGHLAGVDAAIRLVTDSKRQYLAQADIAQAIAGVPGGASKALAHPLLDVNLIPSALRAKLPPSLLFITDQGIRQRYNDDFLSHELERFSPFFDELGGVSLANEQREACIRLEDSNLLVASAGSGKSATMVGKVAYVLQKGLYAQSDILVLAFNKKAADELKERIARQLGVEQQDLKCRVTTFHALGRSIIEEVDGKPPQLANWIESANGEARFIDKIIKELVATDPKFRSAWLDLLTLYPKADIPLAAFDSMQEYQRYIADNNGKRPEAIGTLAEIHVRSLQERSIVNWLWRNQIQFEYEKQVRVPDTDEPDGPYRYVKPDFYYPESETIHEHFAIGPDGKSPFPNYVEHASLKRQAYARIEADFFETRSAHSDSGELLAVLERELKSRGFEMGSRSDEEILAAVSPAVVTHYHKIIAISVKHIRSSRLSRDILHKKAEDLHDRVRARHFVDVVHRVAELYSSKLEESDRIDFDSMIGDAVQMVETGSYTSPFSLILVDEFQDISVPRAALIRALKHQQPFNKVFAVGDDWQSIYRFTGSDITIFTDFEANFGPSWQGRLQRTYRCNQLLADTAASFVQRNPKQLTKSVISSRPAIPQSIRVVPVRVEKYKETEAYRDAAMRILKRLDHHLGTQTDEWKTAVRGKLTVLILWRYNMLDPFGGRPPTFDHIKVSGLSFHRSKGLEADYTILLDVSEGDYGVPSRIEDDELLNLVIPLPEEFAYAEERRLFYVALTRASRGVFLLVNEIRQSRYIHELCEVGPTAVRFETADGRKIDRCPKCHEGDMVSGRDADETPYRACSRFPACEHKVRPAIRPSAISPTFRAASTSFNSR